MSEKRKIYSDHGGEFSVIGKKPKSRPYLHVAQDDKYAASIAGQPLLGLLKAIATALGYEVKRKP